jgi:hypothetical protein
MVLFSRSGKGKCAPEKLLLFVDDGSLCPIHCANAN